MYFAPIANQITAIHLRTVVGSRTLVDHLSCRRALAQAHCLLQSPNPHDWPARLGTVLHFRFQNKRREKHDRARRITNHLFCAFSMGKLQTYASSMSLMRLANHDDFVATLQATHPEYTDSCNMLIDTLVDTFHDFFALDSVQRRRVTDSLRKQTKLCGNLLMSTRPCKMAGPWTQGAHLFRPSQGLILLLQLEVVQPRFLMTARDEEQHQHRRACTGERGLTHSLQPLRRDL